MVCEDLHLWEDKWLIPAGWEDFTVFPSSQAEAHSNIKMRNIYKAHIYHLLKKSDSAMSLFFFFFFSEMDFQGC